MIIEKIQWHRAVQGELISSREVHVWRLLFNKHYSHVENIKKLLSADELERAGKFHFEKDHSKFIMARGVLRMILAGYLGLKPRELRFEYTSFGKPFLSENNGSDIISFSLSHSDDIALYAVTINQSVGVDVERIKESVDIAQIANRFFSTGEIQSLECIHEKERPGKFFQYWTRKEALVKAIGKGISFPLELIDVSLVKGKTLSPIKLSGTIEENSCWNVQDLYPGHGYAAAIATEGSDLNISLWDYQC